MKRVLPLALVVLGSIASLIAYFAKDTFLLCDRNPRPTRPHPVLGRGAGEKHGRIRRISRAPRQA